MAVVELGGDLPVVEGAVHGSAAATPNPAVLHAGPLRRYVARAVDQSVIGLLAVPAMVWLANLGLPLRNHLFFTMLSFTAAFFAHIVIAAFQAVFGNSPGKWIMGVRVKSLSAVENFEFYLRREMMFFVQADALNIPFATFIAQVYQYFRLTDLSGATTYDDGKSYVEQEASKNIRLLWLIPIALAGVALAVHYIPQAPRAHGGHI